MDFIVTKLSERASLSFRACEESTNCISKIVSFYEYSGYYN